MTLLIPLGLLGLLGIVALIVIYIIKPNYQQKSVSSTYVWKLSLKYKKKKLPVDKIRDLILLICQILILTLITWILTKPVTMTHSNPTEPEVVVIIDSSASMYAETDGVTRFENAVNSAIELSEKTFDENGYVSVIVADSEPSFLAKRIPASSRTSLTENLNALLDDENTCSYGTSDIQAALDLCEEVFDENTDAEVYILSDTTYNGLPESVTLVSVENGDDDIKRNAAVLDATVSQNDDASVAITTEIASYGANCNIKVSVNVSGVPSEDGIVGSRTFEKIISCEDGVSQRLIFTSDSTTDDKEAEYYSISTLQKFYSYETINVYITVQDPLFVDSFSVDDSFVIYGGKRQVLTVQYASSTPADFFPAALDAVRNYYDSIGLWDIQVTDVKKGAEPALSGFDLYIFEHTMPEELPTDGVVILVDPDPDLGSLPTNSGLYASTVKDFNGTSLSLVEVESHEITKYVDADSIHVSRYVYLTCDSSYTTLMTANGDPAVLVRNDIEGNSATQIAVMAFSVHYSNLSYNNGLLPFLMIGLFEYYFPSTVESSAFDVNETISLNARSNELHVTGSNLDETITTFPAKLTLSLPGSYTVTQTTYYGQQVTQNFYVKIPSEESNINKINDVLLSLPQKISLEDSYDDWLVYLAGALVALIFAEWIIKSHENV